MTTLRKGLRKALWSDRQLDNQSNDLRDIIGRIPDVEYKKFLGLYQTGITFPVAAPPLCVECVRCRDPRQPQTPIPHGAAVSFDLSGSGGIKITLVEGLTFSGQYLEMIFRITYGDV